MNGWQTWLQTGDHNLMSSLGQTVRVSPGPLPSPKPASLFAHTHGCAAILSSCPLGAADQNHKP